MQTKQRQMQTTKMIANYIMNENYVKASVNCIKMNATYIKTNENE